jgi:hypothetical protein
MRAAALFALVVLVPAALNAAPAAPGHSLLTPVCTGDGQVRTIRIPLDKPQLPGSDPSGCCVKSCHAPGARKRAASRS